MHRPSLLPRRPLRYPVDAATRKRCKYAGMFRWPVESTLDRETLKKLKKGLNCTTAGPFIRYAVQLLVKGAQLWPFTGLTNSFRWSTYNNKLGLLPSLSCMDYCRLSRPLFPPSPTLEQPTCLVIGQSLTADAGLASGEDGCYLSCSDASPTFKKINK